MMKCSQWCWIKKFLKDLSKRQILMEKLFIIIKKIEFLLIFIPKSTFFEHCFIRESSKKMKLLFFRFKITRLDYQINLRTLLCCFMASNKVPIKASKKCKKWIFLQINRVDRWILCNTENNLSLVVKKEIVPEKVSLKWRVFQELKPKVLQALEILIKMKKFFLCLLQSLP